MGHPSRVSTPPDRELLAQVRALIGQMEQAARLSNDALEVASDRALASIVELAGPGIVAAIRTATGTSKRRRELSAYLLSGLTDDPEALELMRTWIRDPDDAVRSVIIQTIGGSGLRSFAQLLTERIEDDPDAFCRDMAIHAAGALRAPECLPAILRLADGDYEGTWRLAQTLAVYATNACRPHLLRWFGDESQPHAVRLQAAWGLGKLGDRHAIDYLVDGLVEGGEAVDRFRCAQALSEINGWDWTWDLEHVAITAERVHKAYGR
jgi:HEAT repeat protein